MGSPPNVESVVRHEASAYRGGHTLAGHTQQAEARDRCIGREASKEPGAGVVARPQSAPPAGILIGYARCSTEKQDLTAQREILRGLGVAEERVYLDHGLTGTNRTRPGLNNALAALREGDTLVVPKLDRLARSVPDARAIGDSLAARGVRLSLGGSVYDPSDPMGKCFFNILATFAEFEVDLLRMRTREGVAIARAKGRLKGKHPSSAARRSIARSHDRTPASLSRPAATTGIETPGGGVVVYAAAAWSGQASVRTRS
jgi:DNA invertase Pin-like site-specific DNA recombinase